MKSAIFVLLLIATSLQAQVTETELIGNWKTSNVVKKPDNPYYRNVVDSFKSSTFVLGADHIFEIKTTQNSQDFANLRKMTKGKQWKFDERNQLIKVGTPDDNFSAMKIKVRRENGQLVFKPDERGTEVEVQNIEIKKPE